MSAAMATINSFIFVMESDKLSQIYLHAKLLAFICLAIIWKLYGSK